jgi:hypothetical protein
LILKKGVITSWPKHRILLMPTNTFGRLNEQIMTG